jgi:hypothetical protein
VQSSQTRWKPILELDEARDAIDGVARDLQRLQWSTDDEPLLASGRPGLVLLRAYQAAVSGDPDAHRVAEATAQELADRGGAGTIRLTLWNGLGGTAWTLEHVAALLGGDDGDDVHAEIDDAMYSVITEPVAKSMELFAGLAGLAVYAAERMPRPSARRCLEAIVAALDTAAERHPNGVTWYSARPFLPRRDRAIFDGYHSLGVAHGCPGPIAALATAALHGVDATRATELVTSGLAWLWEQQLPRSVQRFPSTVESGTPPPHAGWCYGDPGIATVMLASARAAGLPLWEQRAVEIARDVASMDPDRCGISDPMFCHGAAGLGHMMNRFYQATGEEVFRDAAVTWFVRLLAMRTDRGVGGFVTTDFVDGASVEKSYGGVLDGSAGVALALLAATSSIEPGWDRVFLASIAPPR